MEYHKNIESALKELRPTDKIVKILSNKFAIVKSLYTNDKYAPRAVCVLVDNEIRFIGKLKYINEILEYSLNVPKISKQLIYYKNKTGTIARLKTCDNRKYIKRARKLAHLLETFNH